MLNKGGKEKYFFNELCKGEKQGEMKKKTIIKEEMFVSNFLFSFYFFICKGTV